MTISRTRRSCPAVPKCGRVRPGSACAPPHCDDVGSGKRGDCLLSPLLRQGGALRLVRRLKSLGLIDGVGLQSHYGLATPTTQQARTQMHPGSA